MKFHSLYTSQLVNLISDLIEEKFFAKRHGWTEIAAQVQSDLEEAKAELRRRAQAGTMN